MKPQTHPNPNDLDLDLALLDAQLRRAAEQIHPRASFRAALRDELRQHAARPVHPQPWLRRWLGFSWARSYLAQVVVVALLVELVAFALRLTPQLTGAPAIRPGQPRLDTPRPGQDERLAAGLLAQLGKGTISALDTAADGRLAVGAASGVCLYSRGLSADWCQPLTGGAWGVRFNPAGDRLAVVTGGQQTTSKIAVLDAANGQTLAERETQSVIMGNFSFGSQIVWDPSEQPRLLINEDNGRISVWNWQTNTNEWNLSNIPAYGQSGILALDWALGPGGESIVAAGGSNGLTLIDGLRGDIRQNFQPTWQAAPVMGIAALAFSPAAEDGSRWLAYTYSEGLVALKVQGWTLGESHLWQTQYQGTRLAWSQAGASQPMELAVESNTSILVFQLDAGQPVRIYAALGWSPLAWGQHPGSLFYLGPDWQLFRAEGDQAAPVGLDYTAPVQSLVWLGQEQILSAGGNTLNVWDVPQVRLGAIHKIPLNASLLALQNRRALYSSYDSANTLVLWDTLQNQEIARFTTEAQVWAGAFTADGSRFAVVGHDGTLRVFDIPQSQWRNSIILSPKLSQVDGLALSPDGSRAAVVWMENSRLHLDVENLTSGARESTLMLKESVQTLTWSADGSRLAAAAGLNVLVIDLSTGQILDNLGPEIDPQTFGTSQFNPGEILSLAFSADGKYLAAGGRLVTLWDLNSGRIAATYNGQGGLVRALAFRPDGLALAAGQSNNVIALWDLGAGPQPTPPVLDTPTPIPTPGGPTPAATQTFPPALIATPGTGE